ncbi:MAG: MCP four helix bundle domain-containing protein, partial [Verrucomicrobiae bacterium]|nr:MCP four helix bundle domain-containing protein [Verrucomicrobiae bacterium]
MNAPSTGPRLQLATRLLLAFLAVATVTLFLGLLSYRGASSSRRQVHEIGEVRLPSVESLLILGEQAQAIQTASRTLLIPGLPATQRQLQYSNIAAANAAAVDAWNAYEALPQTPEVAALWRRFVPAWETWHQASQRFLTRARSRDALDIPHPVDLARQIESFSKDHHRLAAQVFRLVHSADTSFE